MTRRGRVVRHDGHLGSWRVNCGLLYLSKEFLSFGLDTSAGWLVPGWRITEIPW
jgi:hypothetical protein